MTVVELMESQELSKKIADLEFKLASWRKQRDAIEKIIEQLTEKMLLLKIRQNALIGGKAENDVG